jgi:hypothetical protein
MVTRVDKVGRVWAKAPSGKNHALMKNQLGLESRQADYNSRKAGKRAQRQQALARLPLGDLQVVGFW